MGLHLCRVEGNPQRYRRKIDCSVLTGRVEERVDHLAGAFRLTVCATGGPISSQDCSQLLASQSCTYRQHTVTHRQMSAVQELAESSAAAEPVIGQPRQSTLFDGEVPVVHSVSRFGRQTTRIPRPSHLHTASVDAPTQQPTAPEQSPVMVYSRVSCRFGACDNPTLTHTSCLLRSTSFYRSSLHQRLECHTLHPYSRLRAQTPSRLTLQLLLRQEPGLQGAPLLCQRKRYSQKWLPCCTAVCHNMQTYRCMHATFRLN